MNQQELMHRLELILEDSKTGILATVDTSGKPQVRWMTPVLIKGRNGVIFAVTSPHFLKVSQISEHPDVTWLIQTRALNRIITIRGKINVLDNPSIKTEVLEAVGQQLTIFWKLNEELMDFVVLETIIEDAEYFEPMKGIKDALSYT